MKKVYICSDTEEGIFSAVYDAWKTRLGEASLGIALRGTVEQAFFCEYLEVEESSKKVSAVQSLIRRHLGEEAYRNIYYAMLSHDLEKGDAILGMMLASRNIPDSHRIMEYLTHAKVQKVFQLGRKVANEAHYYKEFIRFEELQDGILFAEIEPRNRILTCIADHFSNRFPVENWVIYDKTHMEALVHERGKKCILAKDVRDLMKGRAETTDAELLYVNLWKTFFQSISISERESYERQRQNLPLLFREHMTEFK